MSRLDPEVIISKLSRMVDRIDQLKSLEFLTLEEYLQDELRQRAIERLLEVIIQAALEINKTLLKRVAGITPSTPSGAFENFESFILIGEHGFISQNLAKQLAPSGSLRNILAHEYDNLDPTRVYESFQAALTQYPQYVQAIQAYLDRLNNYP
ncbi:type VII toxin-antitoxin system HepT family RNase toxin [Egbenema bharatensis]|uniref:type VII toxin-antitoxin system HepT family RNase toxin n=1 Tax=Egbenema bharatensis TaxID=3463334 RepID=UPI003A843FE3